MHIFRKFVFAVFCCAVFSAASLTALLAVPATEAEAQESAGDPGQAVVEEARGWMGTGYGAYGADCSGFTSLVYGELGVYLPDHPGAQYAYGSPSDAEAGDLVFFDEHGTGISHVGIATGNGTMIHSSIYFGTVVEAPIHSVPGYVGAADVV